MGAGQGDLADSFGEIIRRQRELAELSMRQFASAVGISNPYLSQIERGLREPSEQVAEAIARALSTTVEALYEEAGLAPEPEGPSAVEEAIRADPRLTARQRQALLTAYEAFTADDGAPRRRRRSARAKG
jgi:transcriptional regulator with XRE-family HTH domain